MSKIIGSVGEVALDWGLEPCLLNVSLFGYAYVECLRSTVESSDRAKIQAGAAYTRERRVVLNAALLVRGRERDRNSTFLHECAHILADLRFGRNCRHDRRWEQVMEMLGEEPNVRHRIDYISAAAHAVETWLCDNCGERYHFVRPPRRRIKDCYCRPCGPRRGQLRIENAVGALAR
ncbi:MAG TPA: SprT-like domain-containing protein [Alphaproteobacteria bacterium]|jgi:SprT protein|nr:SprT-like domain-containing protein [Alphaproteobacteria bacterium]